MAAKTAGTGRPSAGFGSFLTMIVGLLVFFGVVSRIGKATNPDEILSARQAAPVNERRVLLDEERARTAVLIGDRREVEAQTPVGASKPSPAPVVNPKPIAPPASENTPPPAPQQRRERAAPTLSAPERYYSIAPGDTLWKIAEKEYGNGAMFALIQKANPGLTADALRVGKKIVIPPAAVAQTTKRTPPVP